jgi:hypothetical protein
MCAIHLCEWFDTAFAISFPYELLETTANVLRHYRLWQNITVVEQVNLRPLPGGRTNSAERV